jgi:hypothetical protein
MANLTIQSLTRAGCIVVDNGHDSPQTVYAAMYIDGQTVVQGMSVAVPAGARRLIKPLPMNPYTNPANGRVSLTYSGATLLTIGIFRP